MKKLYTASLTVTMLVIGFSAKAQNVLFVDTGYTAQQMVMDFFGNSPCVTVSNVTFNAPNTAIGFFDAAQSNLGLNAGMIISTGSIFDAPGPNQTNSSGYLGTDGDNDLTFLSGFTTFDASVVEFDIVSSVDTLCFRYVFGSDEYSEYVGSLVFNDIFAFFVSGPGYNGLQNIALVPGTNTPVSINNVNCVTPSNPQFYVCNDPYNSTVWMTYCSNTVVNPCPDNVDSTTVGFDGFTTPLCAKIICTPGATYHIKLAIADVSDSGLDSGVFIDIESLCGSSSLPCVANFLPGFGADGAEVNFANASIYGSSWFWDFGDGNTSNERHPTHVYDADGVYMVKLVTCNSTSCDTTYQQLTIGETGINSLAITDIALFPNPATSTLSVNSISGNGGSLSIYDAAGRLMINREMTANALVDVSSFTNGVYTVELLSNQGIHRTRFIKQ